MARQAWNRGMEPDRIVLEHIRALLLALAVLVERAACLPTAKRLWFLEVMGRGEAEARRLIVAMASDAGASGEAVATPVHSAGDAAQLAARFRMLALAGVRSPCRHTSPAASHAIRNPLLVTSQSTPSPAVRATSPPVWAAQLQMAFGPPHPASLREATFAPRGEGGEGEARAG